MTVPRVRRDWLMAVPSLSRWPVALVFFWRSDPARSTKFKAEEKSSFESERGKHWGCYIHKIYWEFTCFFYRWSVLGPLGSEGGTVLGRINDSRLNYHLEEHVGARGRVIHCSRAIGSIRFSFFDQLESLFCIINDFLAKIDNDGPFLGIVLDYQSLWFWLVLYRGGARGGGAGGG